MLDFHIHMARLPHPGELSRKLLAFGYRAQIVACEPWEWEKSSEILPIWSDSATPGFGIHPQIAETVGNEEIFRLREFFQKYPQAFVSECGLDKRFPGYGEGQSQEKLFRAQARLAREFERPLMLHVVGDYRRCLKILESEGFSASGPQIIFHRFGGDTEIVNAALRKNALFSLHTDSFRKPSTKKAILSIPEKRVRFETDADENFFPATAEALANRLENVSKLFAEIRGQANENGPKCSGPIPKRF